MKNALLKNIFNMACVKKKKNSDFELVLPFLHFFFHIFLFSHFTPCNQNILIFFSHFLFTVFFSNPDLKNENVFYQWLHFSFNAYFFIETKGWKKQATRPCHWEGWSNVPLGYSFRRKYKSLGHRDDHSQWHWCCCCRPQVAWFMSVRVICWVDYMRLILTHSCWSKMNKFRF